MDMAALGAACAATGIEWASVRCWSLTASGTWRRRCRCRLVLVLDSGLAGALLLLRSPCAGLGRRRAHVSRGLDLGTGIGTDRVVIDAASENDQVSGDQPVTAQVDSTSRRQPRRTAERLRARSRARSLSARPGHGRGNCSSYLKAEPRSGLAGRWRACSVRFVAGTVVVRWGYRWPVWGRSGHDA